MEISVKTLFEIVKVKLLVLLILSAGVFVLCQKDDFFEPQKQSGESLYMAVERASLEVSNDDVFNQLASDEEIDEYKERSLLVADGKSEENAVISKGETYPEGDCVPEERVFDLYTEKNTIVGQLVVSNTDDSLYLAYQITKTDCYLKETHLYVGRMDDMPASPAYHPVVSRFPYKKLHDERQQRYVYVLSLKDIEPCCIIAAHADIYRQGEAGEEWREAVWSYGNRFPNAKARGWYSDYCKQCVSG